MSRRRRTRHDEVVAARRRHPTAVWLPDLDEMRRRALVRAEAIAVTPPPYQNDDEPPA